MCAPAAAHGRYPPALAARLGLVHPEQAASAEVPLDPPDGVAYGYGWFPRVRDDGQVEQVSHTGGDGVFFAASVWRPFDRIYYYLVTNTGGQAGADLASTVLRILRQDRASTDKPVSR